ncbi:MFS transporter [Jiangella ureilytica]|uniref:MFS transporter n=1 Tax=Jiangella ureilytica TaxID=2530374 RepID=A0A4R4RAF7_9ACTN|nr:MFS transporter [Jiangella ureilytica]TDC45383.1 MFS transporter [Jiangella ureilytica]
MRRLLLDLTPLKVSVPYRRLWIGISLSGIGTHLTTVAVGLQVYDLTGSTFNVGLVGLFALVPLMALGLYGGAIVDAYDRRRVVIVSSLGLLLVACGFAVQAWLGLGQVWLLYALVAVQNGFFAVNSPARTAIIPRLLPGTLLPAANALGSMSMSLGLTVGPLLAGLLIDTVGYGWTYSIEAVLLTVALTTLAALPPMPPHGRVRRAGLSSVLEGLSYLRSRPNVRMTFIVDLCAMVLAMPRVLFPAVAASVLGGGSTTVGILVAGMAVGAFLAGLFSGPLGHVRRQGFAVVVAIIAWALSVVAFGVVLVLVPRPDDGTVHWALWPAVVCMVLAGAADTVSAVFRMTILQAATPDELRGRLQGVFIVVVAGGPRLGDLVLGSLAELSGEAWAAIIGGLVCVVVVTSLAVTQRRFVRYDARHPEP